MQLLGLPLTHYSRSKNPTVSLIVDHTLVRDQCTACLVDHGGKASWLCLPRFDSPASAHPHCCQPLRGSSQAFEPTPTRI